MTRHINSLFRRFKRDQRGAVAVLVAASIVAMLGFGALVVDLADVLMAQSVIRASANAAALAGAQEIGNGGNPIATATTYSSQTNDKNAVGGLTSIAWVTGYPKLTCATNWAASSGVACSTNYINPPVCDAAPCATPASGVNLITVEETANVPIYFGRLFGISSIPVKAAATASAQGYAMGPYNVAIVLDTTASMGDAPAGGNATTACSSYSTAIKCAVAGAQVMLGELWPCASGLTSCTGATPVDAIALFVFPPVTNASQAATDISCTNPAIASYYAGTGGVAQASPSSATLSLLLSPGGGNNDWGILAAPSTTGPKGADMTTENAFATGSLAAATDAGTPTSQATASRSKVLTFPSGVITTHVTTGLTILDMTTSGAIPAGTTVASVSTTASTVTMSANATGSGVASGDLIKFGTSIPAGTGTWPFWTSATTMASTTAGTAGSATLSASPTGAGVLRGDNIFVAPVYKIVGFNNDYRTSDTSTTLNSSSNIVKITAQGCLGTPGGLGTYYADAITAAQNALVAEQATRTAAGQPAGQNVIVFLSDGNASSVGGTGSANTTPLDYPVRNQMGPLGLEPVTHGCQQAVTAAQNAAKAGTTVYTIYYDDNGTNGTCEASGAADTGSYTGSAPNGACYTLQQMANAPGSTAGTYVNDQPKLFYSTDGTGTPCPASGNYTTIAAIFQHLVATLTKARLVPVNTE